DAGTTCREILAPDRPALVVVVADPQRQLGALAAGGDVGGLPQLVDLLARDTSPLAGTGMGAQRAERIHQTSSSARSYSAALPFTTSPGALVLARVSATLARTSGVGLSPRGSFMVNRASSPLCLSRITTLLRRMRSRRWRRSYLSTARWQNSSRSISSSIPLSTSGGTLFLNHRLTSCSPGPS